MNELRWILIGFGMVLLAGIYLWGRRGNSGDKSVQQDTLARTRAEPGLHAHDHSEPLLGHEAAIADDVVDEPAITHESMITAVRPATRLSDVARTPEPPADDDIDDFIDDFAASSPQLSPPPDLRRGRVEPTFSEAAAITEELPVDEEPKAAPTLSSSDTPQPRRIERRKILALRLAAAPQRLEGSKLLEALQAEALEHGKYSVFHRLHDGGVSVFSVASMVEPGTFDLDKMAQVQYTGITLFAQLPGPVPGMHALNELVACARRLQQTLGGTLQDDRGVPLTVHRIERLRQEVREFERPASGGGRSSPLAHSPNPDD